MAALQLKADSISSEVSQISDALRGYLDHGIASGRKVQPPRTKAGRNLLQHLLGRLDQVSTGLSDVRRLAAPHTAVSVSPSAACGLDTPSSDIPTVQQQTLPASEQVEQPRAQLNSTDHSPALTVSTEPKAAPSSYTPATPLAIKEQPPPYPAPREIRLKAGSVYHGPVPSDSASPLFDCTYQDLHILNEELFELYSNHPVVRDVGYFKLQVRDLPPLNVQKMARPSNNHATSFNYKADRLGLVKVDTGKRLKFASPRLPLPMSAKMDWSLEEQRDLWNSSAADPPKGTRPYIIGNPLFDDVVLSPGEKLRRRGRATLEGINTQYVYFNLTGKTITTMHREDAHVRSENLLRSGQHKFWCFVKPAFAKKLEERMALEYPEMRRCSQAVRHLSRHIPPAILDEWGVEYTLDYCVPGQAVVTEPGTYHQVLNLGPNYAIAINLEYSSSPDMPLDYRFCDKLCPDKFAISVDDFRIYDKPPPQSEEENLPRTPDTAGSQEEHATVPAPQDVALLPAEPTGPQVTQSATPPPERAVSEKHEPAETQPARLIINSLEQSMPGGQCQHTFASPPRKAEVPPPPPPRDNTMKPPPTEPQHTAPSTHVPELNSGSGPRSVGQPNMPQQQHSSTEMIERLKGQPTPPGPPVPASLPGRPELAATTPIQQSQQQNRGGVLGSSDAQSTQPRPPSLEHFPGRLEPAVSAPVLPSDHHLQAPGLPAKAVAYAVRALPQVPPGPQQHAHHPGNLGPRIEGLPPIRKTARMIRHDREPDTPPPRPLKKQRVDHQPAHPVQAPHNGRAVEHLSALLRGRDMSRAGSLAAEKLGGKPAFERLAHLVREWRRYSKSTPVVLGGFRLIRSVEETSHGYPELHTFLSRFFKMKVASCVVNMTARPGQPSPQKFLNGVLHMLGWPETKQHRLHDYLREGSCWGTICGSYDGLLCLIPPDSDCLDLALFKDELVRFHSDLNNGAVRKLCAMGDILQKSIWDCLELPEFIWESTTTTWLTVDRILPLLAPFRLLRSNYYDDNSGFHWPRPPGWHWNWPADPSGTMPGDNRCDLCTRKSCRCAETKVPQIPRISDDKSKGPGIRSVGPHKANDILGELVGELVPLGACAGSWAMTLCRPDLDGQPVAEIHPRRMGNWVRKVSHSTSPSAAFKVMKISGRWRQMLVAIRDIRDGEEITAKYGKGFLKEQPYSVVEGL